MARMPWRPTLERLVRRGVIDREPILQAPKVRPQHIRTARLSVPPEEAMKAVSGIGRAGSSAAERRQAVIQTLIGEGEPLEVQWIYAETGANLSDLRQLEKHQLLTLSEAEVWRDPLEQLDFVPSKPPQLTSHQAAVWESIQSDIHLSPSSPHTPFLLHGVTGSGKTEIYLRAVDEVTSLDRGAIVLVPEIALTPQTVRRFVARYPGRVGLIHSQLSKGERYDTWRRCRSGELKIVVGPRSALFTPMPDIGLIVLDESHDESYKEHGQSPRYHARDVALAYAKILGATCIFGSATPDVTSMYATERGDLRYLSLPQRILGHRRRIEAQSKRLGVSTSYRYAEAEADMIDLPPVQMVDMRQELRAGNRSIFSRPLQKALKETLLAGHQAILFLNRRGAATYVFCRDCGEVLLCPRCDTPLTYHQDQDQLLCHHCGYQRLLPQKCPQCSGRRIRHFGAGTQTIETEVAKLLPKVRTLRWDWDSTRRKGSHDVILSHFSSHRADVLIGTQMIAKGLDLPLVTLVGVVSSDTGLNFPDYRASERTFQILTQVAGRAGRGLLGGKVILQTYQPEHYALQAAAKHDYGSFYAHEIQQRKRLRYPPFKRLARLVFKHHNAQSAEDAAVHLGAKVARLMKSAEGAADLIGPVPCFFMKLRGDYRWQIVIRADQPAAFIPEPLPEGWTLDIDPVSLL